MYIQLTGFSRGTRRFGSLISAAALFGLAALVQGCAGAADADEQDSPLGVVEQGVSGQTNPGSGEVLVCPDANYGGYCTLMGTGLYPNSAGVPNDSMSSIKVGSGTRVTLCADSAFRGTCQTIDPGRWLGNLGYEAIGNDRVSSVRVVSSSTPDCRGRTPQNGPPSGWVFLYRDANYRGDCVAASYGEYWNVLDAGMANDSISSVLIPTDLHTNVTMFQHQGYQGDSYSPYWPGNSWFDWDDYLWLSAKFGWFNDQASSLSVWGF